MSKLPDGKVLESMSPWDIAELLGVGFTGDMNPVDHGGTWYETRNWVEYGYASAVSMYRVYNRLYVEFCTINKMDLDAALRCCGWERCGEGKVRQEGTTDELDLCVEMEIECCLSYAGAETDEDFSGPYLRKFRPNKDGNLREFRVWDEIKGWLESLAE